MFHTIDEFVTEWKAESEATAKVMDALTDASLQQSIGDEGRSLGQIAWHLVWLLGSMTQLGLEFEKPEGEERAPSSAERIASEYKKMSQRMLHTIETQWTDASLNIAMDPQSETWTNEKWLRLLIQHEVHHRGQMTVLLRQAGLRPPGLYGPTREDWIEAGKEPYI